MLRSPSLSQDVVDEYLANGRKLKETVDKTVAVDVVQWELNDRGDSGRELFYLEAKINPQSDIDDDGYVTQSWFRMNWIRDIQIIDEDKWVLMTPAYFILPDPLIYFRCHIEGVEAGLLPSAELGDAINQIPSSVS